MFKDLVHVLIYTTKDNHWLSLLFYLLQHECGMAIDKIQGYDSDVCKASHLWSVYCCCSQWGETNLTAKTVAFHGQTPVISLFPNEVNAVL